MQIFLAYRFTGEDIEVLKTVVNNIGASLKTAGHSYYCSLYKKDFFDENKFTHRKILEYALDELNKADCILAFVKSEDKSEGMLLEIGHARARGKKFILAIKKGVRTTFLREIADNVIEWENLEELYKSLSKLQS